jgi:hypothetical protein
MIAYDIRSTVLSLYYVHFVFYEGNSKINLRLIGKKKRLVIAPESTLSSNK